MKTATEAIWAERVEAWRGSGKTASEFTADKPYAGSTLQWAASRLRRIGSGAEKRSVVRKRRLLTTGAAASQIPMAQVVRRGRASVSTDMVVDVAGARISVRRGFDEALLRDVVRALREGR